ncbi:MAG: endonuclease/exonuclease/phosphatase family protein [Bacteroidetes bacterium]|nr:endonuclease/exonuclease/phosphatase family protein [Bacteroidota bacterium]
MYLISFSCFGQDQSYRLMFYNVENLFDTKDDTLKNDDEFLPDGERHWDTHKFYKKLNNTARVIIGVGAWNAPAVVGLCEIENRFVLNQLVYETPLKNFGYSIIHHESPDWRGIDVAMLYRKDFFTPDTFFTIPVLFPFDLNSHTRDILYVKGRLGGKDTLHIFINHWPSRYGGYLETQPKREFAAGLLKHRVDSLFRVNPENGILIMGDFNDGPSDESVSKILKALPEPIDSCCYLVNLMAYYDADKFMGTLKYRENWDVFDQVIVSSGLLDGSIGIVVKAGKAMIYQPDFLLEKDERYMGNKPFRTFYGFEYLGGFSDHLPVYVDLEIPTK